jgi:hypothetical protein
VTSIIIVIHNAPYKQAWSDPYLQVDWVFDDAQPVCRFCYSPLDRQQPRRYELAVPNDSEAHAVEAEGRYHPVAESRRRRIGYEHKTPIDYVVFHQQIPLHTGMEETVDEQA